METKGFMGKRPSKALKSTQLITARNATPNVSRGCHLTKWGDWSPPGPWLAHHGLHYQLWELLPLMDPLTNQVFETSHF